MRPVVGIALELLSLAVVLWSGAFVPVILYSAYVVLTQLLATYLIHCPAHYAVGTIAGIRFRSIGFGRTTLARALPKRLGALARFFPILTLSTLKSSMATVPKSRISAMYLAGTVASSASAVLIAVSVSLSGSWVPSALSWAFASGYLLFDIVFSPNSGDIMRARAALR